jgi:hypothetical protein
MDAEATNDEFIVKEQATDSTSEDQDFDTFADAVAALEDDENPADGQPEAEEDQPDPSPEDDSSVFVDVDGEKLTLAELKAGYYRQKDYTHKTTEVAEQRKQVEAIKASLSERTSVVETALQNLSGFLQNLIPPEPPLSLARTDPGQYQYQRALRESAIAELGQLVAIKGPVEQTKAAGSEAEFREYQAREQAELVKAMPALADPVKRTAFEQSVKNHAKAFGFTDQEIAATADHRVLRVLHYAAIGQRAEQNRAAAAKRVDSPKPGAAVQTAKPVVSAEADKAKRRFYQTRSIKDATKLDFD